MALFGIMLETGGGSRPITRESLITNPLAPYYQVEESEKIIATTKVIMEELARLREQSSSSG